MVVLNKDTFKENFFETVYDLLDTGLTEKVIGGFTEDTSLFPIVVLGKPSISPVSQVLNSSLKVFEIELIITIQDLKNKEADKLSDKVRTILLANEKITFFDVHELYEMTITEEEGGEDLIQGKEVHSNVLTLTMKWDTL